MLSEIVQNKEFLESIKTAADTLKDVAKDMVTVITHYDGDGLAAGAILLRTIMRLGLGCHLQVVNSSSKIHEIIKGESSNLFIFSDIGTLAQNEIHTALDGRSAIILDHHKAQDYREYENIVHVNPNIFGVNGSREVCGATLSFLFAMAVMADNSDLVAIGTAGGYGDKQYVGGWKGINKRIIDYFTEKGYLYTRVIPALFGPDIGYAIAFSTDPYFVGLSNNIQKVRDELSNLGLDPEQPLDSLNAKEMKVLNSYICMYLLKNGVREEVISAVLSEKIFGTSQTVAPDINLMEANNMANACGRMQEYDTGIRYYLGDISAVKRAIELREIYRTKLRTELKRIEIQGFEELRSVVCIYGGEGMGTFTGSIAGLAMDYIVKVDKPVITLVKEGNSIKVSARGTNELVDKGLDLSVALKFGAESVGGRGGGHPVAAGADIPIGKEKEFISKVDEIISEQLLPLTKGDSEADNSGN